MFLLDLLVHIKTKYFNFYLKNSMTSQQQHIPEEKEVVHNTERAELAEIRGARTDKDHH